MIPKSIIYKLVRLSDRIVIAEGNKKDMHSLRKKTAGCVVYLSGPTSQLGKIMPK